MRALLLVAGLLWTCVHVTLAAEEIDEVRICGSYTLETYRTIENHHVSGRVAILRDKKTVYERTGFAFSIGRPLYDTKSPTLLGQDLTASGTPHVVLYEWTGGAHGAHVVHVLRLGAKCETLATINGASTEPKFVERPRGEPWEIHLSDHAFEYWPSGFAGSPFPKVVLRWDGSRYVVARDRMLKPALSVEELKSLAARLKASEDWKTSDLIPAELYATALDLLYSGHETLGWTLLKDGWGRDQNAYEKMLASLKKRLAGSEYWAEVHGPARD